MLDAYLAGAPQLDVSEAWEQLQEYLEWAARDDAADLHETLGDVYDASPDWRRRLGVGRPRCWWTRSSLLSVGPHMAARRGA